MQKLNANEKLLVWLDSITGLDIVKKQELFDLIKETDSIKATIESKRDQLIEYLGDNVYNALINSANKEYFSFILKKLDDKNIYVLTVESEDYPEELLLIEDRPLVLYLKGDMGLLKENKFGVVGSRKSLPLSIRLAEDYTAKLCENGIVPVTGIANGVDETVLKTALANGGKCISIIAGGFDNVYPKSNQTLLEEVAKTGLVISEYPPEIVPMPYFFPIRNRIIAGLSKGVLIVSGGIKSGTIYTAEYAFEYGKDVFAIPYSVGVSSGVGCNDLIKRGAILTDSFNDIKEYYNLQKESVITLTEEEKEIVKIISDGNTHIDKICSILNKQIFEIMPVISVLEIKGVIIKSGFNTYSVINTQTEA